jgi:hypothetical protein
MASTKGLLLLSLPQKALSWASNESHRLAPSCDDSDVHDIEVRLVHVLGQLQAMHIVATGASHPSLDKLTDPEGRRDPATLNWLVATASGTLPDRWFCAENGDREPDEGFPSFNSRWTELLTEAAALAADLRLPAAGHA